MQRCIGLYMPKAFVGIMACNHPTCSLQQNHTGTTLHFAYEMLPSPWVRKLSFCLEIPDDFPVLDVNQQRGIVPVCPNQLQCSTVVQIQTACSFVCTASFSVFGVLSVHIQDTEQCYMYETSALLQHPVRRA